MAEKITKIQIGEELREIGLGESAKQEVLSEVPTLDTAALAGAGLKEDGGKLTVSPSSASPFKLNSDGLDIRLGSALGTALGGGLPVLALKIDNGFATDSNNRLSLKLDSGYFTLDTYNNKGWLLQLDTLQEYIMGSSTQTLKIRNKNLEVKLHDNSLGIGANGLKVNLGSGLATDDTGIKVKVDTSSGLAISDTGLYLMLGSTLGTNVYGHPNTIDVLLTQNSGLRENSGLCVNVGTEYIAGLTTVVSTPTGGGYNQLGIKLGSCPPSESGTTNHPGFYFGSAGQLLPNIGYGNSTFDNENPFDANTGLIVERYKGCLMVNCGKYLHINNENQLYFDATELLEDSDFITRLKSALGLS